MNTDERKAHRRGTCPHCKRGNPWIDVNDRLPDDYTQGYLVSNGSFWWKKASIDGYYSESREFVPTHWIVDGARRRLDEFPCWMLPPIPETGE